MEELSLRVKEITGRETKVIRAQLKRNERYRGHETRSRANLNRVRDPTCTVIPRFPSTTKASSMRTIFPAWVRSHERSSSLAQA